MSSEEVDSFTTADDILRIYPPVFFTVGLCGNILFLVVALRPNIRRSSISLLFVCLSLSDTAVLTWCVLKKWIGKLAEVDLRSTSDAFCKADTYLTYFLLQLSPWILVVITIERTYSILYPHKVKQAFTKKRLLVTVTLLIISLAVANVHILFAMNLEEWDIGGEYKCLVSITYERFFYKIWPWIDMCLMFFIPVCFLLIGNIIIIVQLRASQRFRTESIVDTEKNTRSSMRHRTNAHISSFTKTTVLINTCFIVLLTPSVVFTIGQPYWYLPEEITKQKHGELVLVSTVCFMLMYTYNAVNFILYMLCGSRMRNELLRMCRLRKSTYTFKTSRSNSGTRTSSRISSISDNVFQMTPIG